MHLKIFCARPSHFLTLSVIAIILAISAAPTGAQAGKRYALLVGVNDYLDQSILKLGTPRNDAKDLGATLLAAAWDKVFVLTDDADARSAEFPTRVNIEKRVNLLSELASKNDVVFLFFSGHGANDSGDERFLPVDADLSRIKDSGLSIGGFVKAFNAKGITKVILAVDACRETLSKTKGLSVVGIAGSSDAGMKGSGVAAGIPAIALYATQVGWYSYEDRAGRNGVFTKFLIEGLKGAALPIDAKTDSSGLASVTGEDLARWLPQAVAGYALDLGIRQKPVAVNLAGAGLVIGRGKPPKALEAPLPASPPPATAAGEVTEDDMVLIPAGSFTMGDVFKDGQANERPAHKVTLSSFLMKRAKVNVSEMASVLNWAMDNKKAYMREGRLYAVGNDRQFLFDFKLQYKPCDFNGKAFVGDGDLPPVCHNSWYLCCAYANWLSEMNGFEPAYNLETWSRDAAKDGYRLPTEAEWEYAARNAGKDIRYPWGNEKPGAGFKAIANLNDETQRKSASAQGAYAYFPGYDDGRAGLSPVNLFPPNGLGLIEMMGNMMEFVEDGYYSYTMKAETNPRHETQAKKIIRGAGYDGPKAAYLPTAFTRIEVDAIGFAGFRLVRKAP